MVLSVDDGAYEISHTWIKDTHYQLFEQNH